MNDYIPWLIGAAVLVAVLGALRLDSVKALWSQWLGLNRRTQVPPPPPGHPIQNPAPMPRPHEAQARKPDFHRSGKRH